MKGGLCPKTFCWGLSCSWTEVEVGLSLEETIWGSQAAPLSCSPRIVVVGKAEFYGWAGNAGAI